MPWKLSYLDTDPKKQSKVIGEWYLESMSDVLDTLEYDYDEDLNVYDIVITYVDNESVPFCIE